MNRKRPWHQRMMRRINARRLEPCAETAVCLREPLIACGLLYLLASLAAIRYASGVTAFVLVVGGAACLLRHCFRQTPNSL